MADRQQYMVQYRADHADELREKKRAYQQRPDVRAKTAERDRIWRAEHPEQRKEYHRNYMRNLRRRYWAFMDTQECADCGEHGREVLEWHHLGKDKEFEVGSMLVRGWNRMKAEMAKCAVLCANCHRRRHFKERQQCAS